MRSEVHGEGVVINAYTLESEIGSNLTSAKILTLFEEFLFLVYLRTA